MFFMHGSFLLFTHLGLRYEMFVVLLAASFKVGSIVDLNKDLTQNLSAPGVTLPCPQFLLDVPSISQDFYAFDYVEFVRLYSLKVRYFNSHIQTHL